MLKNDVSSVAKVSYCRYVYKTACFLVTPYREPLISCTTGVKDTTGAGVSFLYFVNIMYKKIYIINFKIKSFLKSNIQGNSQ